MSRTPKSRIMLSAFYLALLVFTLHSGLSAQAWQSAMVHFDPSGNLVYARDSAGNSIADFSYAGYRNGGVPLPDIAVVDSVSPIGGDNTSNIQNAISRVASRPLDANGFRGALLLKAGRYQVSGTLLLNASGVVVRGLGEGSDSLTNTIIYATGDSISQPTVLIAGGGNSGSNSSAWSGSLTSNVNIISDSVHVGERTFQVADASPFTVGDNIIIVHPKTLSWLRAINFGGVPNDTGTSSYWAGQTLPILYNRHITAINSTTITIDAPVFTTIVRALSQSYIYKTNRSGILTKIGIEHLRIDIMNPYNQASTADGDERHHAQDALWLGKIEDAWVRHCTTLHFVQSGFKTSIATRVTIDSCSAIDPISIITGERRYNFNTYVASQLILFSNCYARYARHAFVSNGTSTVSGIVFYHCTSEGSYNSSEGHRLWSQGMLYDNFVDVNTNVSSSSYVLGLYNRGDMGSGHGWAAVHSVAWNCNSGTRRIIIQKPPTAQNYAIGCTGIVTGAGPFSQPQGYIEKSNISGLDPPSLYIAQLNERLAIRTPPPAPLLLSPPDHDSSATGSVRFSWGALTGVNYYWLEYSTDSSFASTKVDSTLTDSGITVTALPVGHTYWWRVRARNNSGWGYFSTVRSFRVDYSQTVLFNSGWNMVSLPVAVEDPSRTGLFPEAVSRAFSYSQSGGYVTKDSLVRGVGYWIKLPSGFSRTFHGYQSNQETLAVAAGWNLVGSISSPVAVATITSDVPGLIISQFFGYDGSGYQRSDTVKPGSAYWVKAHSAGDLFLGSAGFSKSRHRVSVQYTGEHPPSSPDTTGMHSSAIPKSFDLGQNFPNPFNPVTAFTYGVSGEEPGTLVSIRIYDAIGQEVATLVNEVKQPGYYTVVWDASGVNRVPSGVYYCRMIAGQFAEIRKLVLVR